MPLYHFLYFQFCNTDMSFLKITNFPSSTMLQIFMIWKPFTYIRKKSVLLSIISKFLVSLIFRICANSYCSVSNDVTYIINFQKKRIVKMLLYLFGIFILATLNFNFVENFMKKALGRKPF